MRLIATTFAVLMLIAPVMAQDGDEMAYPEFTVSSDLSLLPKAVAQKRQQLIDAAMTGDIEALRPIIEAQEFPPTVSYGGPDDAVDYLKTYSADGQGIENLAILLNLLNAPYAVFESGSYVWPYLAVMPNLADITPAQKVDAYRLLGHEEYTNLVSLEAWYYWRVYIGEDGEWQAFVAGD